MVYFPNLGLTFHIPSEAFRVFGVPVYWYGIILTTGIILGTALSCYIAKKENIDPNLISDFVLYDLVFAIIGARLYYVAFNWDYYKMHLSEIINIRQGGIAIYGSIIASVIVIIVYTKIKKIPFAKFTDIAVYGLLLGQIIGRYGNFFNKEAFGDYTDNLFAMALLVNEAKPPFSANVLANIKTYEAFGTQHFIQVHPTFLYESCWNLVLLIGLLFYRNYQKADGEILCLYLIGYGIGRFWIEGLRVDQLLIGHTQLPISQIVACLSVLIGLVGIFFYRKNNSKIKKTKLS